MRQFAIPPEWVPGSPCILEGGPARYLARVLRLAPGDSFPGLDSSGRRWLCELREAAPDRLVIAIGPLPPDWDESAHLEDLRGGKASRGKTSKEGQAARPDIRDRPSGDRPRIILIQGLPKGAKMDLIVRQAAEAGVARVLPLFCSRSASRGEDSSPARLERWRRIAREALQQSGSAVPTAVDPPRDLAGCLAALGWEGPQGGRRGLVLDAEALAQSSLHRYLTGAPDEVVLCVGPEGGLAAEETRRFLEAGFAAAKLPCAVLRTETAALYAVAAVEIVLSERDAWIPRPR